MTDLADGVELLDCRPPNVVFCPHPLMPARGRRLIFEAPRVGEKLDAYLVRVIGDLPDPCVVTIGDRKVPREWWGRVAVKPGVVIGVAAGVAGGDGSDVGRIVLTIAVVVAAVYTGGLAAGAMGWSGAGAMTLGQTAAYVAASAAVMTVGMMAVNALMPLPTADLSRLSGDSASPTYSLNGGSNRARRYEPLPLVIGTHRMFPDAACATYTLYLNGNDQYLFAAYNFGFGDLNITDLRIGDTLLTDYQDVTVAWGDGVMPSLVAANVDTQGGTSLTVADGAIVRTTSVDTTEIHIDLQYVMFRAGGGGLETLGAMLKFEYRATGAVDWLPFNGSDGTVAWFGTTESSPLLAFANSDGTAWIESTSRTPWRNTLRKLVPKGQYDLRITKITPDVTAVTDTCEIGISAIRSLQPDEGDYSGQRILALKIRASAQLNGVVNQLSGLVSHRLNGVATSNPARWFKAFALGSFSYEGRRRWGAGLALSRLDVAALDAWATWCDTKGLTCDLVLDAAASCATVLDRIARCGRASKTWAPGVLSAVWDADGLPVTAMFSPVNIRKGSFSISYPSEPLADELEVSYINPDNNWQRDSVRVPASATGVKRTASVELLGCTNTALAGKEANLLYAQNLYRFRTISWETDIEGLTIRKGNVVSLSHDLTQWGQAGRLVSVASTTSVSLDRTITLKPTGCWMAICRPSGEISYHRVQVGGSEVESDSVTLLDPLPTTPAADGSAPIDWRYTAEAKATPGWRVKITEMVPLPGMDGMRIFAQDDPDEYYSAESGTFTHVASPVSRSLPALSGLQVSEELIRAGAGYAVQLHLTWSASGDVAATRVRFRVDAGPWQEGGFASGTHHVLLVPESVTVTVEVTGFNGVGQSNLGSRLSGSHVIVGQDVPPPAVTGFGVSALADGTRAFVWTVATVPPDVTYLEIRYAASSGTAWAAMTPLGRVPFGAGRAESNVPAAGTWTFEARMLDASGNYSASGARATVTLGAAPFAVTNTIQLTDGAGFGAAAAAAQAAANSANAKHDELASDYKLSPLEKQAAWKEYGAVSNTYWGIDGKAAAFGIGWQRTAHGDRFNELSAYLSPLLANLSTTSDIDGPTWRAYWSNYYAARQTLLNEIYAVAGTTALWSGVAGAGKPIDNAGKVIDLGDGGGAGQRHANDAPGWYPMGTMQQFKWSASVGLGFSEWGVLRTEQQFSSDGGGPATQTWKSASGEWKRTGTRGAGWTLWTRRIDRPITSGNAADFVGAGAINTTELNGTAASERVVLFDAAGVSHANYG